MGTADTWVQAHDSDGAAKFKLPKSFAHKLPARVANDVGMVAWENPSPWAQEGKTVKSHVNGLSLFDDAGEPVKVHGLAASEAIEIVFPGAHWPKARCSWWDAEGTEWKTDGVETEHRAADTLCKTTHLTEFALVESDEAVATALGGSGVGGG